MHLFAKISPAMSRPVVSSQFVPLQSTLRFSLLALSLLAALGQSLAPAQAAEPRLALAGSAPAVPALRSARLLGRLDSSTMLRVGLTLPLRHQSQLDELLRRQYTPGDALYHQFLTPLDFTARFGPTLQDYEAVADYARAQGLTITDTSPGRTLLNVAGPSVRIEAAFGVQMSRYRLPSGRLVFANQSAPLLPRSVALRLAGIVGLNNISLMHPYWKRMRAQPLVGASQSTSHAPIPITGGGGGSGSGPLGGFSPNDIKYAYDLSTISPLYGSAATSSTANLNGAGQNIGLYEEDGFATGDIALYVSQFALPTALTGTGASVTTIPLGGFKGIPISVEGQTEVTLDIDMILALAPAATGVYVYEDDEGLDAAAPLTIFTRMANDLNPNGSKKPLLQVISCSWGNAEQNIPSDIIQGENTLFQQMAAQGQSVFCSSGDNGAYDLYDPLAPALTSPAVDNPSSQPYVTGVGGTTLSYTKPGTSAAGAATPGTYVSETAWSAGTAAIAPEGSGGGVSSIWSKPGYQQGVGASPTRRDVPDVSLNADPNTGYSIYAPLALGAVGVPAVVGGTSAAAPLWAAYTALINQQRAANGLGSIGFLNPQIYPIGAGITYSTDFHDIVSGSNLYYQAGVGFDDATGYGSFVGAPLLAALSFNANQGTGTATLTGLVTDTSVPPVPIVGATVSAITASSGSVAATATTDSTGAYTLTVPSGLSLKITVSTSSVTAPAAESFTGQTVSIAALAASGAATQNFTLSAAHVYAAGLQMISAPFDYTGIGDFAAVFGLTEAQANLNPRLIQFAPLLNSYIFYPTAPADTLRLGQGYWVRFPSVNYLHISGTPAFTSQAFAISLQQGWNQIGDPFILAAPLSTISVINSSGATLGVLGSTAASTIIQPTLYGYNTTTNAYAALAPATDSLQPYAGYWVFAFQKSTLSVPVPGPPPVPLP